MPNKLDDICGAHSFKAMKPMLGYFRQMKLESDKNNEEIKSRENSIKKLEDELNEFRTKAAANDGIVKELRQQLELFRKSLSSIGNCDSLRAQMELQNTEITQLKAQNKAHSLKLKDYENQLKSQGDKTELELYNITVTYEL